MKNKIIKIACALVVFATVSISCSDEFVDRDPVYSIDSENYFNSEADYNQALIAAYDLLQASYVNVLLGEIALNAFKDSSGKEVPNVISTSTSWCTL